MDQSFRKSRIDKIQERLNFDLTEAQKQHKSHKTKGAYLDKAEYGLTATMMLSGLSVLSTIALPPVGITMGIITSICGIAELIVKTVLKKNAIKTQKWYEMYNLIDDTQSKISQVVSDVLDDNVITDSELKQVERINSTYREKLTKLRNEYLMLEKSIKLKK